MLNHSSAKSGQRTANSEQLAAGTTNGPKNKTRKLNGSAAIERRETYLTKSTRTKTTRTKTLNLNGGSNKIISKAIKRRAQAIIEDRSIDAQSRAIIRYGLETNDPWLPELVRRADAGETIIYTVNSLKHPHPARRIQRRED